MSDAYRLVFRGEVLEGQHPAVVRKRLGQAAEFDAAALDKLFSGRPVIVKRAADTQTAARLQALFKKAGARLRVLPVEGDEPAGPLPPADEAPAEGGASDPAGANSRSRFPEKNRDLEIAPTGGFEVLPPGADILRADERTVVEPRSVDTSNLSLEGAKFVLPEAPPAEDGSANGPDVSHLTVASAGTNLVPAREQPDPVPVPDLSLAAPGERLAPQPAPSVPPVEFTKLEFEVAPVGADLDQRARAPVPAAPNVSHLELSDPD